MCLFYNLILWSFIFNICYIGRLKMYARWNENKQYLINYNTLRLITSPPRTRARTQTHRIGYFKCIKKQLVHFLKASNCLTDSLPTIQIDKWLVLNFVRCLGQAYLVNIHIDHLCRGGGCHKRVYDLLFRASTEFSVSYFWGRSYIVFIFHIKVIQPLLLSCQ